MVRILVTPPAIASLQPSANVGGWAVVCSHSDAQNIIEALEKQDLH